MNIALTIAGSDSGGGAGIQADIKTMTANGVFATSVVTALTAQNTLGVRSIQEATPSLVAEQIDCVFEDLRPQAVKIGMVSSASIIDVIAERLAYHKAENIVLDPVMVATSGARLIDESAIDALVYKLAPMATLITPNIMEARVLCTGSFGALADSDQARCDDAIEGEDEMQKAACEITHRFGVATLVKGGHSVCDANDVLCTKDGVLRWFRGKRVDNPNTHGTGCTLSSAIAANLAKGFPLAESIERAKGYLSGCLGAMLDLGQGRGPMNHAYDITTWQEVCDEPHS